MGFLVKTVFLSLTLSCLYLVPVILWFLFIFGSSYTLVPVYIWFQLYFGSSYTLVPVSIWFQLFPSYVPALLAAAECHSELANQSITGGLFPVAVSHIETGIRLAWKCTELRDNYSSVWYRIGEIGMLGRYFDTQTEFNLISTKLFTEKPNQMVHTYNMRILIQRS